MLLLGLQASAAVGQPRGASPAADTTGSPRLLDRWNFHPTYTSQYQLNRTSRTWDQGLSVNRGVGPFALRNQWNVSSSRDEARSDFRSKRGLMTANLDYRHGSFGGWTVGLDGRFSRNSQLSSFQDRVGDTDNLGLAVSTELLQRMLRTALPPLAGFTFSTGANLGLSRENNVDRRSTRVDTTRVRGLYRTLDAGLSGNVKGVSLRASVVSDRGLGESKTVQRSIDTGELVGDPTDDETENRRTVWDASANWKPTTALSATGTARFADDLSEYWDALANDREGGQEQKTGQDWNSRVQIEWKPSQDASLRSELRLSDLRADYALQARDFRKTNRSASLDGRWVLPSAVGPISGTEITATYSDDVSENSLEQTSDYRQENRRLRLVAKRQLLRSLNVGFTEEVSLQQYFYADRSNDRDERRLFLDGTMNYRPNQTFNGIFSVSWNQRQAISIPEANAGNNNASESYKVSGDLTYARHRMSINQRYTIQADYTFFDFNEDNNTLVRTNGVQTSFKTPLAMNTGISLRHQYEFRDRGSYVRRSPSEPRGYARDSEETRHVLTLNLSYAIARALRIDAQQLFDRRERRFLATDRVTVTDRSEWSIKAHLEREIAEGFSVNFDFTKTESSAERNYWTGRARLERRF